MREKYSILLIIAFFVMLAVAIPVSIHYENKNGFPDTHKKTYSQGFEDGKKFQQDSLLKIKL